MCREAWEYIDFSNITNFDIYSFTVYILIYWTVCKLDAINRNLLSYNRWKTEFPENLNSLK